MGGCTGSKLDREDFHSNLIRLDQDVNEYENNYTEGELLGEGITGCVKKVVSIKTGRQFAMKSINLDKIDKAQIKELKTEIEILKQLDHPNIVRLHEVYQSKNNIKIVMELLTGGDLSGRILTNEADIRRVIFQLVSACRYWHSRGIVHRDLKVENILFSNTDPNSDVKVIDFGLSATFISDELVERQKRIKQEIRGRGIGKSLSGTGSKLITEEVHRELFESEEEDDDDEEDRGLMDGNKNRPKAYSVSNDNSITNATKRRPKRDSQDSIKQTISSSSSSGKWRPKRASQVARNLKNATNQIEQKKRQRRVTKSRIFKTTCGSAFYMAPEIMFGKGYTEKCDLWAIGVLTFMLITRKPPFPGNNEREVFQRVRKCSPNYRLKAWQRFPPSAIHFVKQMLMVNPSLRWSAEQALNSSWFKESPSWPLRRQETSEQLFERKIIESMRKFATYSRLKQAALMIISHYQSDFQNQSYNHCFLAIDQDNTGQISRKQLYNFVDKTDLNITEEEHINIFNSMDQDHSGHVRYMEFFAACLEAEGTIPISMMNLAFNHLDAGNEGYITLKSMQKLLGKSFTKKDVAAIIKESDLTGDKKISKEEFMLLMGKKDQDELDYFSVDETDTEYEEDSEVETSSHGTIEDQESSSDEESFSETTSSLRESVQENSVLLALS